MLKWHYSKPPRNKTFIYFDPYKNTFLIHFDNNNWRKELNAFMFWTEESIKIVFSLIISIILLIVVLH